MNLEEIESLRKRAVMSVFVGIIFTVALALLLFLIVNNFMGTFLGVMIGVLLSALIICKKPVNDFKLAFKNTYVLKSLQEVFTDLVYKPEQGIDESIIRNTQMMNMGDRYSSNDYIEGKYKNINVVQADVHIQEEHRDSDGDRTYVTIFKGRWMIFDFNKSFKANIQVCQKGFGNARINNFFTKTRFKKINMEDQSFNNIFRTYAQDEHDAFYILTPSLMEKLKNISNKVKGKLLFCFIDNKLHIGIYNREDSFEHSIFQKINEEQVIKNISKDITLITNFIDELNLDNDLFRKEE